MKRFCFPGRQNRAALPLLTAVCLLFITLGSCRTTGTASGISKPAVRLSGVSFLSGASVGGMVENSQAMGIEGGGTLDSITGATEPVFNAGIHTEWKWRNLRMETGLDYLGCSQTVDYQLPGFGVEGSRDFRFHQIRIPLTGNLHLLKNRNSDPGLIIKAGVSGGYTFHKTIDDSGSLEEYRFTRWDFGPTLGVAIYPFPAWKSYRPGFYLDFYRGSRIFSDPYHEAEGLGGQSFMKMGVTLSTPVKGLNTARGESHE